VHAGDILQEDWILEELSYLIQVSVSCSRMMLISDFCFSLAKTLLNEIGLGSLEKDTMKFSVQDYQVRDTYNSLISSKVILRN
jgi:hypothetical protein